MAKQSSSRQRFTVLALAGMVLLHHLGILSPLILTISALAAIWVIIGLAINIRPVRRMLWKALRWIEGRLLCEQKGTESSRT